MLYKLSMLGKVLVDIFINWLKIDNYLKNPLFSTKKMKIFII